MKKSINRAALSSVLLLGNQFPQSQREGDFSIWTGVHPPFAQGAAELRQGTANSSAGAAHEPGVRAWGGYSVVASRTGVRQNNTEVTLEERLAVGAATGKGAGP